MDRVLSPEMRAVGEGAAACMGREEVNKLSLVCWVRESVAIQAETKFVASEKGVPGDTGYKVQVEETLPRGACADREERRAQDTTLRRIHIQKTSVQAHSFPGPKEPWTKL